MKFVVSNIVIFFSAICELISNVKLDLSQYAMDIVKLFSGEFFYHPIFLLLRLYCLSLDPYKLTVFIFLGSISSKEESNRAVAVEAIKNLAHQCSDPGAVEKVANHLFKVLGGTLLV